MQSAFSLERQVKKSPMFTVSYRIPARDHFVSLHANGDPSVCAWALAAVTSCGLNSGSDLSVLPVGMEYLLKSAHREFQHPSRRQLSLFGYYALNYANSDSI